MAMAMPDRPKNLSDHASIEPDEEADEMSALPPAPDPPSTWGPSVNPVFVDNQAIEKKERDIEALMEAQIQADLYPVKNHQDLSSAPDEQAAWPAELSQLGPKVIVPAVSENVASNALKVINDAKSVAFSSGTTPRPSTAVTREVSPLTSEVTKPESVDAIPATLPVPQMESISEGGTQDRPAEDEIEISWNRAEVSGGLDGEISLTNAGVDASSSGLGLDPSLSGTMHFGTSLNGSKSKTVTKPSLQTRVKTIVCKLPDPTLLFLFEVATILTLHTVRPLWLRTIFGRLGTILVTLLTVGMAAIWRGTVVKGVPGTKGVLNPVRPIPRAAAIVRRGEQLRAREAAVAKAEEELHVGQLKLRSMRRDIERRLPPAASISHMLESDASVSVDDFAANAKPMADIIASIPSAGSVATPAGAVGAARAPSDKPHSARTLQAAAD